MLKLGMEHKKFTFDREMPPVASIKPGESVLFETEDANVSLNYKGNRYMGGISKAICYGRWMQSRYWPRIC